VTQPQTPEQIMAGIMADPRMARNATWRPFLSAVAEEVLAAAPVVQVNSTAVRSLLNWEVPTLSDVISARNVSSPGTTRAFNP